MTSTNKCTDSGIFVANLYYIKDINVKYLLAVDNQEPNEIAPEGSKISLQV